MELLLLDTLLVEIAREPVRGGDDDAAQAPVPCKYTSEDALQKIRSVRVPSRKYFVVTKAHRSSHID